MTGKKWTNPSQEAWLKKNFAAFLQADSTSTRKTFFNNMCLEWQKQWPDPEPTPSEVAAAGGSREAAITNKRKMKDKQVRNWFDNHKRPSLSGTTLADPATRTVLSLTKPRGWHQWQAFADLRYKALKPAIDAEFAAHLEKWNAEHPEGESDGVKKPLRFTFQNAFLKAKYDAASDEEKAEVEEHRLKMLEVAPDEINRQRQIAIDKLPLTFATILDNIAKQTGWQVSIMAGGPRPSDDGKIASLFYTTGTTKEGQTYQNFLGPKLATMEEAFDDYLHECFSDEDCAERALSKDSKKEAENMEEVGEITNEKAKEGSEPTRRGKSDYEIQKEKNIAQNKILLAQIKDPEFEDAMRELKKDLPKKKKAKTEKAKPNEERRTSARLNAADMKTNSTDENSGSMNKGIDEKQGDNSSTVTATSDQDTELRKADGDSTKGADRPDSEMREANGDVTKGADRQDIEMREANGDSTKIASDSDDGTWMPVDKPSARTDDGIDDGTQMPVDKPSARIDDDGIDDTSSPQTKPSSLDDSSHSIANGYSASATASESPAATTASTTTAAGAAPATPQSDTPASTPAPASTDTAASTPTSTLDDNLPGYLTTAIVAHLRNASALPAWQDLVAQFLQFEKASPPAGKLSTASRPVEVAPWIKRHVNKKHEPVNVNNGFGIRFRAWWTAMQPSWRIRSDDSFSRSVPEKETKETWAAVRKGGSAGIYVLVMALSWWIASLKMASDDSQLWDTVNDVAWVLSAVKPTTPPPIFASTSVKRASPESSSPPSKRVKT